MLEWRDDHFRLYAWAELVARRVHVVFQYLHLDVAQVFVAQALQQFYGPLLPVFVLLEEGEDGAPVAPCGGEQLVDLFRDLPVFLIGPEGVLIGLPDGVFFREPSLVAGVLLVGNLRQFHILRGRNDGEHVDGEGIFLYIRGVRAIDLNGYLPVFSE